jgi:hypothetical protein
MKCLSHLSHMHPCIPKHYLCTVPGLHPVLLSFLRHLQSSYFSGELFVCVFLLFKLGVDVLPCPVKLITRPVVNSYYLRSHNLAIFKAPNIVILLLLLLLTLQPYMSSAPDLSGLFYV